MSIAVCQAASFRSLQIDITSQPIIQRDVVKSRAISHVNLQTCVNFLMHI